MKNREAIISVVFGLLSITAWYFPAIELQAKILITCAAVIAVMVLLLKERLSYFFRRYWHEIVILLLIIIVYQIFDNVYPQLLIPATAIILTSIVISLIISFKYRDAFIYRSKVFIKSVAIDDKWDLNHWSSSCATINKGKMYFTGTSAPSGTDGSNINLLNILDVGNNYEITCFVKSEGETDGRFQLWCHDSCNSTDPNGVSEATNYRTPPIDGETIKLNFKATFNRNIRIHLQYTPGAGTIIVDDVKIVKLTT